MKKIFLFLLFISACVAVNAEQLSNAKIVIVRYIHDGNQTYSYNPRGVENHFENLALSNDKVGTYQALKPFVDKMKTKRTTAIVVSSLIGLAGGAAVGYGGYMVATEPAFIDHKFNDKQMVGCALVGGGVFAGFAGITATTFLTYSSIEEDIMQYINRYNYLNPESPLEVY